MTRMRARRGFTLLEVLVALVVTAMVVTLSYGAAQAGFDTEARLAKRRVSADALTAWRALLGDAIRHVERGVADDDAVFVLAGDSLQMMTRGVVPPLGTGERWLVTLAPGAEGVRLSAAPVEGSIGQGVSVVVRDARGLRVRVLPYVAGAWTDQWPRAAAVPAAVSVQLLDADGRELTPVLVARTRPAGESEEAP